METDVDESVQEVPTTESEPLEVEEADEVVEPTVPVDTFVLNFISIFLSFYPQSASSRHKILKLSDTKVSRVTSFCTFGRLKCENQK